MSKTQPRADSRDMFVVHDTFRRQFTAIRQETGWVSSRHPGATARILELLGTSGNLAVPQHRVGGL